MISTSFIVAREWSMKITAMMDFMRRCPHILRNVNVYFMSWKRLSEATAKGLICLKSIKCQTLGDMKWLSVSNLQGKTTGGKMWVKQPDYLNQVR